MATTEQDRWDLDEDGVPTVSLKDTLAHDTYWAWAHAYENYYRAGLDYEDYAPAYCVGYVGHAQYGGDFAEAEKALLANWLRIRGDSRLELDEARMAMRAAWDRCAALQAEPDAWARWLRRLLDGANGWLDRAEQQLAAGVGLSRGPARSRAVPPAYR